MLIARLTDLRSLKHIASFCLYWLLLAPVAGTTAEFNPVRQSPPAAAEPAMQAVLVQLKDHSASGNGPRLLAQRNRLRLMGSHHLLAGLHALHVEPTVSGDSLQVTLAQLRADPAVQYAEPDQRRYAHAAPNDPLFQDQWYLQSSAAAPSAVDALSAWNATTGSAGLVIAELDTGVRFDHPDLLRGGSGGRLLPGYDFVTDPVVANDGDGRDADASDPGDWVTSGDIATANFSKCTVTGSSWHGTRVAGILGAITNNSTGIAGFTWSGWILPVRVLGKCGGTDSDILAALLWSAGLHVDGVPDNQFPAKIINMSLGATGPCPAPYQSVISQLTALGVLVVVSAGNEGGPVDAPANCSGVAGIAGLRHAGTKVGFSSLGPQIALSAPAGNCVNTVAGQPCLYSINTTYNTGTTVPASNAYTDQTNTNLGTSFSAPIVAGIAALMKSVNGNLSSAQMIARLRESATPFPTTSSTVPAPTACHIPASSTDLQQAECLCTTQTCGAGMANANAAMNAALRPIAAIAVPGNISAGQNVMLLGDGSAAACGHSIAAFAWTVVSAGTGTAIVNANMADAMVVAPSSGSITLRLTVTDDAGRTDSTDVALGSSAVALMSPGAAGSTACLPAITLDASGVIGVTVAPASVSLVASGKQVFVATVTNTGILPVTWQVNGIAGGNAAVGTISATGLYTAPAVVAATATVTVTAVTQVDASKSGAAQVTIASSAGAASSSSSSSASSSGSLGSSTVASSGASSSGGGGALDGTTLLLLLASWVTLWRPAHRGRVAPLRR